MAEQTIPDVGAFTVQDQEKSQANFDELYAAVKGGTGNAVVNNQTVNGALAVTGNSALTGTLAVTGASTLTGALAANGGLTATTGAFTGAVSGLNVPKTVLCTTQFDAVTGTTGVTLTSVIGLSQTVAIGSYKFKVRLATASTANTGFKCAFKLTTAVLSAIDAVGTGFVAAASATTHTTTTTDQTLLFDSAAGAELGVLVEGIMVFSTAGTIAIQAAQHTAHADTTSVLINSFFEMTRIA